MPVAIPRVVRQAWGEEVVAALVPWMEERFYEIAQEKAIPRDEYREVLSRLDLLDGSVSLIRDELMQIRAEFRDGQAQVRAEFREDMAQMRAGFSEEQVQMRAEFREDMTQMRAGFSEEQAQMRAEFREDLGEFRRETHERLDRMNERFNQMHGRFDEMHHQMIVQTRWLVGSLTMIGTVVSVLLAIAQFTP